MPKSPTATWTRSEDYSFVGISILGDSNLDRGDEGLRLLANQADQHQKTKVVDALKGEAFGFLGFDLRRVRQRNGEGYFILMTPKKKARKAVKAKIRDIIARGGATPMPDLVKQINATLAGWVNYFRVGNSSRAFSEVRDYVEMKVRTLLTRRKRRRKSSVGWRRWSNEYLYEVLGLFWDWKIQPLPGLGLGRSPRLTQQDSAEPTHIGNRIGEVGGVRHHPRRRRAFDGVCEGTGSIIHAEGVNVVIRAGYGAGVNCAIR